MLGGRGYLEDMTPLARLWRDVRLGRIGGGTDEMMWELVAGGLQGDDELYDRFVRTDWCDCSLPASPASSARASSRPATPN